MHYLDRGIEGHTPDKWVIVRIEENGELLYKLLMSWYGGYLGEDRWKINSGIQSVVERENDYMISGYSGSVYYCHKGAQFYGMSSLANGIYNKMKEGAEKSGYAISVMDCETAWLKLKYV